MFKKVVGVLIFGVFFLFNSKDLKASHIMGADLTYRHIVGDSFLVTLKVYRDCNGITVSSVVPLIVSSSCRTDTFNMTQLATRDITGIPSACGIPSRCSGSYNYGIQEITFQIGINFSDTCCAYKLGFYECCRNSNISTGSAYEALYIEATLNKCLTVKNSSPVFITPPRILLPHNQSQYLVFTAMDTIDNDFVTYELVDALKWPATSVTYSGSWSAKKPITFGNFPHAMTSYPGGLVLDTAGNLMFRPVLQNQVGVVAVKATEWRFINGIWTNVGDVTRDMQIWNIPYTGNKIPNFNTYVSKIDVCNFGTTCQEIEVVDADSSTDTLQLTFTHKVPGLTLTQAGPPYKPKIKVCYTPDSITSITEVNKYFTVRVTDNKCTLAGFADKTFELNFFPGLADSFKLNKTLNCYNLKLSYQNNSATLDSISAKWEVLSPQNILSTATTDSFSLNLNDTGWYTIILRLKKPGLCGTRIYKDRVYLSPLNTISVEASPDTAICFNPNILLKAKVTNGNYPLKFKWHNNDSADSTAIAATTRYNYYWVEVEDSLKCKAYDTVLVEYFNPQLQLAGDTAICYGDTAAILALPINAVGPKIEWAGFADTTFWLIDVPTASRIYYLELTDSFGCQINETWNVNVYKPIISLPAPSPVCHTDTLMLSALASGGLAPYTFAWQPLGLSGDSIRHSTVALAPGWYKFSCKVTDTLGCIHIANDSVLIKSLPTVDAIALPSICEDASALGLGSYGAPSGGTWSGTGVVSNSFDPTVAGIGPSTLTYFYTDAVTGCSNEDTSTIVVNGKPNVLITALPAHCVDASALNLAPYANYSGGTWSGPGVSGTDFTPSTAGVGNHIINYFYTDSITGCFNEDTAVIKVNIKPAVNASVIPAICEYDSPLNLAAFGTPLGGTWSGSGTNSGNFNPGSTGPGNYGLNYFYTDSATGCFNEDSTTITVNSRPGVTVSALAGICENDLPISLAVYGTPSGGLWSGFGIQSGSFDPAITGAGNFFAWYSYTDPATGCENTDSAQVTVNPLPVVIALPFLPVCEKTPAFSLAPYGTPLGGTWLGTGVSGNNYNPDSAGIFLLQYDYTDTATGCSASDTAVVAIDIQPMASFTVDKTTGLVSDVFTFTNTSVLSPLSTSTWNFGDPGSGSSNIAVTKDTLHQFSDTGLYSIKLVITGGYCPADSLIKTNYIYVVGLVSVQEPDKPGLKIYPNPAFDKLFIESAFSIEKIKITDVQGKVINLSFESFANTTFLNIEALPAGTYFIYAEGDGMKGVIPFIVSR